MVSDDEVDNRQVSGIAGFRPSPNTKLGRWIAAIIGRAPEVGETVDTDDLIQRDCRVVVKHKASADGQVFANVTQVLSMEESETYSAS